MRWWPRAPSGAAGVFSAVWTSPVPSVVRTSSVCWPGGADHGKVHCTHVASEIGRLIVAACQASSSIRTSTP